MSLNVLGPVLKAAELATSLYTIFATRLRHCGSNSDVEPKRVQTWLGHHSIQVTFDTYGICSKSRGRRAVMDAVQKEVLDEDRPEALALEYSTALGASICILTGFMQRLTQQERGDCCV